MAKGKNIRIDWSFQTTECFKPTVSKEQRGVWRDTNSNAHRDQTCKGVKERRYRIGSGGDCGKWRAHVLSEGRSS